MSSLIEFEETNISSIFCRYVRFGEYDVTDYSEHKPKESPVSSLIVHEKYNDTTHDNDIGLMRLVRDIQFDSKYNFLNPLAWDLSWKK